MDDFGMLARDFGFRPQGKSAPMASSKSNLGVGSKSTPTNTAGMLFEDAFVRPPKYTSPPGAGGGDRSAAFGYDSAFSASHSKSSSSPVYDKPVYDEDIFDGLAGMRRSADSKSPARKDRRNSQFDDLLGSLGRKKAEVSGEAEKGKPDFGDLLPGFGSGSSAAMRRTIYESDKSPKPSSSSTKMNSKVMEDPFVVLASTSSPVFDKVDPLDSLGNFVPPPSSEFNHKVKDGIPLRTGPSRNRAASPVGKEETTKFDGESFENHSQKKVPASSFSEPRKFDMSNTPLNFHRNAGRATSPPSYASAAANEMNSHMGASPRHDENLETSGDIWLTVSEVPLFTQPTRAPPPSRPPPPRPTRVSKTETRSAGSSNTVNTRNDFSLHNSNQYSYGSKSTHAAATASATSHIDELENFAMRGTQNNVHENTDVLSGGVKGNSNAVASAAAMKDAMDRAEAKFKHAKEVRERGHQKTGRSREPVHLEKGEKAMQDGQEKELRERQERLDREREREREEEEREQRRLEKEMELQKLERARDVEREREKVRQAVERATKEARERAVAESRLRAERAAVEKAQAEARERAERAAVQRAQTEARERAAAEAKERAAVQRAQGEARERAATEAKERAEKAAAEARERAQSSASATARVNQQKNDDDLESFFNMGSSRPSNAPRPRANSSDPLFDNEARSKGEPEVARRNSVGVSSNIRKASSSTNIADDLTSIFGVAAPSSGDFQDIVGEPEERRRARLERHQRTQERTVKALAEKNQRDLQAQREQVERHRIAETLDVEIKRWAAGKDGNLRALLSTLQYVLWPECGWQPVSLTDLITAVAVKKVYRKATLCIHPDKVQQKGANLHQKLIAEKVFDLLKEAWNKFNSEELF